MATFAISDLHGCYDIWSQINDYLLPEDKLYVLGDVIDRGKDGIKLYETLVNRDKTYFIKGNHEEIAAEALKDLLNSKINSNAVELWFVKENGGQETWNYLKEKPTAYIKWFIEFFDNLPEQYEYVNEQGKYIILNHCGFTPYKNYWKYEDRGHFRDHWPKNDKEWDDVIIVHGHTPVESLLFYFGFYNNKKDKRENPFLNRKKFKQNYLEEIITYCDGHKIDIDCGLPFSNVTCLLNLDTLQPVYFERDPKDILLAFS